MFNSIINFTLLSVANTLFYTQVCADYGQYDTCTFDLSICTEIFCKGCYDRSCKGLIGIQKDFITNRYVNYRNDIKGI